MEACEGREECPALFVLRDGRVGVRSYRFADGEVPRLVHVPDSETIGWWPLEQLVEDVDRLRRRQEKSAMTELTDWDHTLFRLETLPQYLVDVKAERLSAFREGRPVPARPPESLDWFRTIAESVRAGNRCSFSTGTGVRIRRNTQAARPRGQPATLRVSSLRAQLVPGVGAARL